MISSAEYGKALFSLCEEEGLTEKVMEELSFVSGTIKQFPEYERLLDSPAVRKDEKIGMIGEAFAGCERYLLDFLKILCEKREIHILSGCEKEFARLYDESRGIVRCEALTAVPMTDGQTDALKCKLERITGKTVILKNRVSKEILGGVSVRMPDMQLDGSVKSRLDKLRAELEKAIV